MRSALVAFVALLLALPADAREDFTQRDTCIFVVDLFTDGVLASARADHCPSGDQGGDNPMLWNAGGSTPDEGNAPPGSPAGADSVDHNDGILSVGLTNYNAVHDDFSFFGWHEPDEDKNSVYLTHGSLGAGNWMSYCSALGLFQFHVDTSHQSETGWGVSCAMDRGWAYTGGSYDGSATAEIETHGSESVNARTLLDCGVGETDCTIEPDGPTFDAFQYLGHGSTPTLTFIYHGSTYELGAFKEAFADEEHCQICRCGSEADLRGVGRTAECNRCDLPSYQTCRRLID
jgi:hypothetical protein